MGGLSRTISLPSLQLPSPTGGTDLQVGQPGLGRVGGLEQEGGNCSYPKIQDVGKQLRLQLRVAHDLNFSAILCPDLPRVFRERYSLDLIHRLT